MDCTLIEGELVPFHFGTVEPAARAEVEQHLPGCPRCLQAFLELKRVIDGGGAVGPSLKQRPSAATRGRLRGDVAATFGRPRRERMILGAVAAVLVAAVGLGVYLGRHPAPTPAESPSVNSQPVDTARPVTAEPQFL